MPMIRTRPRFSRPGSEHAGEPERNLGGDRHAAGLGEGEDYERGVTRLNKGGVARTTFVVGPGPTPAAAPGTAGEGCRRVARRHREHRWRHARRLRPRRRRSAGPFGPRCRPECPQPETPRPTARRASRLPCSGPARPRRLVGPGLVCREGFIDDVRATVTPLGLRHPVGIGHSLGATAVPRRRSGRAGHLRPARPLRADRLLVSRARPARQRRRARRDGAAPCSRPAVPPPSTTGNGCPGGTGAPSPATSRADSSSCPTARSVSPARRRARRTSTRRRGTPTSTDVSAPSPAR